MDDLILTISNTLHGKRLDAALSQLAALSRSQIVQLLSQGCVTSNGVMVDKPSRKVKEGETYILRLPEPKVADAVPQNLPLPILYQDEDLAVVNKPRGMAVHPSHGIPDGTVVNACLYHLDHLSAIGDTIRPGIVHRLDKDTTGLLVVAKNNAAHENLSAQLKARTVKRTYLALVQGNIKEDEGEIEAPIGRHPVHRKKMAVVREGGRYAKTLYRVVARLNGKTLVRCSLTTGRTHQIRVHMAFIGHPVVGDPLYGVRKDPGRGQMLHAYRLSLIHPRTGMPLSFYAPPPEDFIKAVRAAGGEMKLQKNGVQIGDVML